MHIADMHCDTLSALLEQTRDGRPVSLRSQDTQINLKKMKESGYLLQNFAVFVDMAHTENPLEEALRMISLYYEQLEQNSDLIAPVFTYRDITDHIAAGKMSALLTLEEGGICRGEPAFLSILHRLGARMMTLTWNYENELGYPNVRLTTDASGAMTADTSAMNRGLTETGVCFLEEMERLGMIIDVSHLSDAGFYDVLAHTKKPFVASHSNARSVCGAPRNLTDPMIRALADRGGIAGINFCRDFLGNPPAGENYLQQAVRHMRYLVNAGGEDFVALGSDFDGIPVYEDFRDCRVMPQLIESMKKGGFSPAQIEKILCKNALRVYRELLP